MKTIILTCVTFIIVLTSCKKNEEHTPDPTQFHATNFASGLKFPIGMALDDKGQIWVTENGIGKNDARVSVINSMGKIYPAITGFHSMISPEDGTPVGLAHMTFKNGKLYILDNVDGWLYIADVSHFMAGNSPIMASSLKMEDISTFVKSKNLTKPVDSDVYNLLFGPDDNLYIVDAAANAIIKRSTATKLLSVFAKIPNLNDSTQSVPTGMVYNDDCHKFLVSGLSGFPFTQGSAKIYQVDLMGKVSDYKTGFTALTDIVLTSSEKPLVLQYAKFVFAPPVVGFQPLTGKILDASGNTLLQGLTEPTSLIRAADKVYFVLSYSLGTIQALTY